MVVVVVEWTNIWHRICKLIVKLKNYFVVELVENVQHYHQRLYYLYLANALVAAFRQLNPRTFSRNNIIC